MGRRLFCPPAKPSPTWPPSATASAPPTTTRLPASHCYCTTAAASRSSVPMESNLRPSPMPTDFYQFTDLAAGQLSHSRIQPNGFIDGIDTPGTTGGIGRQSPALRPRRIPTLTFNPNFDVIVAIPLGAGPELAGEQLQRSAGATNVAASASAGTRNSAAAAVFGCRRAQRFLEPGHSAVAAAAANSTTLPAPTRLVTPGISALSMPVIPRGAQPASVVALELRPEFRLKSWLGPISTPSTAIGL